MQHASEATPVSDYRHALMMAAELRSVAAHEDAMIWAQLASFLQNSESYIFNPTTIDCPPTQWCPFSDKPGR
jgi:hypothetical protein